ncbi:MAG: hypothetical protein IPK32_04780 [Verrucomicrobiaceae bacterium]|nr:hypothetical protein [Verrucomicrobiaceae bacterium]
MKRYFSLREVASAVVLMIGLTRMTGYFLGNQVLQGIGAVSGVAPFTKVFCSADGYEAFTARFWLRGQKADGSTEELEMTPERYARLRGPYMRRNVYGAALVFAPKLPQPLRESLHANALRPHSTMWRELGLPEDWISATIRIHDREGQEWDFSITPKS